MERTIQAQHCFFDVAALCLGDSGIMMQQAIIIYITAAAAVAADRGSMPLMHTIITTTSLTTSLSVIKGRGASSIS
jgi:hypothetical protein